MSNNRIALIGCTKQNVALAQAAADAGFVVVSCADASERRARQAAKRWPSARVSEAADLQGADAVIMEPETGDGGRISDTASAVVATVRPRRAVMPFDTFEFHPALCAIVAQVRGGAVEAPGFVRVRHTGRRGSLASAMRAVLNALLQIAPHPIKAFGQVAEQGTRASQLMTTLTLSDGAIVQLNFSEQRRAMPRLEMEAIGAGGLLAFDSHDEVLSGHAYDGEAAGWFDERRAREFWRLVEEAIADESHPFRVDVTRAKRIQRIVKRIEKSIATFQSVTIKGPKP